MNVKRTKTNVAAVSRGKSLEYFVSQKIKYDEAYTAGKPLVSDEKYDKFIEDFRWAFPNAKELKAVGAAVSVKGKVEERLPIVVGSLELARPGQVSDWMHEIEKTSGKQIGWITQPKLDGASLLLQYDGGILENAWTRGEVRNGESFGFNATAAARCVEGVIGRLRDPKVLDQTVKFLVRGEVVIHKSIFKQHYVDHKDPLAKEYKSPRNMVAGLLNAVDVVARKVHLHRCTFVAYALFMKVKGVWRRPTNAHKEWVYLTLMGFTTAMNPVRYSEGHWKLRDLVKRGHESLRRVLPVHEMGGTLGANSYWDHVPTEDEVKDRLAAIHKTVDIDCDGIVVAPINNGPFQKLGEQLAPHPAFMRAIKLEPQDQSRFEGVVDHVEWKVKKGGRVRPKLILAKGIKVPGATITNATCNNARFVIKWGLERGTQLQLIRSGDIIPRIVSVWGISPPETKSMKRWVPLQVKQTMKGKTRWVDNPHGVTARGSYVPDRCPACDCKLTWDAKKVNLFCTNSSCPGEHGERILSFFRLLGVDDVAGKTVQSLIRNGLDTVPKIVHGATPQRLMQLDKYAEKKAALVSRAISGALKGVPLAQVMHASTCFGDEATYLGDTRLQAIVDVIGEGMVARGAPLAIRTKLAGVKGIGPRTLDIFLDGLEEWRKFFAEIKSVWEPPSGPKTLNGVVACWTGFRDAEAARFLTAHGGTVSSGMSRKVTVLFSAGLSEKTKKADGAGIEVVQQSDMWAWLKGRGVK